MIQLPNAVSGKKSLYIAIAISMVFVFHKSNLVDDAFISFRYAENLINGHGLVYNAGERVEGYTNFLWVILISAGMKLGVRPELFSIALSIPIHLISLLITYKLALHILRSINASVIVTLLIGLNWSVAVFARSGLETPLQLLEFLLLVYLTIISMKYGWQLKRNLWISLTMGTALLTRPDAIIIIGIVITLFFLTRTRQNIIDLFSILLPLILIIVPYGIWKLIYYDSLLPNTFNAKVHMFSGVLFGLYYCYLFFLCYLLLPYLLILFSKVRSYVKFTSPKGFLFITCTLWIMYIIAVGGDFMEFRFFIPIMPFLLILIIDAIYSSFNSKELRTVLVVGLLLGNLNNALAFDKVIWGWGVKPINILSGSLFSEKINVVGIGNKLKELFSGDDVTIAIGGAGAVPYYSGLKTIDMLGLNDKEIPKIGNILGYMPGHRVIAPLRYLVSKGVNLVLWPNNYTHPREIYFNWAANAKWDDLYRYYLDLHNPVDGKTIDIVKLIGIPVDENLITVAWYLTPCEAVDRAIREHNLYMLRLTRPTDRTAP